MALHALASAGLIAAVIGSTAAGTMWFDRGQPLQISLVPESHVSVSTCMPAQPANAMLSEAAGFRANCQTFSPTSLQSASLESAFRALSR